MSNLYRPVTTLVGAVDVVIVGPRTSVFLPRLVVEQEYDTTPRNHVLITEQNPSCPFRVDVSNTVC